MVGEVGAATAKATQTAVSPASGFEPEPAVRADVEIPERRMTVTWSIRRNTDKALAASHTIEINVQPSGGLSRRGHRQRTRHPDEAGRAGARHPARDSPSR